MNLAYVALMRSFDSERKEVIRMFGTWVSTAPPVALGLPSVVVSVAGTHLLLGLLGIVGVISAALLVQRALATPSRARTRLRSVPARATLPSQHAA